MVSGEYEDSRRRLFNCRMSGYVSVVMPPAVRQNCVLVFTVVQCSVLGSASWLPCEIASFGLIFLDASYSDVSNGSLNWLFYYFAAAVLVC